MKSPEQRSVSESPQQKFERLISNPVSFLRDERQRGVSCKDLILFFEAVRKSYRDLLIAESRESREERRNLIDRRVHESCTLDQMLPLRFVTLFSLLKDAGFEKYQIASAVMDCSMEITARKMDTNTAIKKYIAVTEEALDTVFDQQNVKEKEILGLINIARNAVKAVQIYKALGKSCLEALIALGQVRKSLGKILAIDDSVSVPDADPMFTRFYKASDTEIDYYISLAVLLRGGGFTQEEVRAAFIDFYKKNNPKEFRDDAVHQDKERFKDFLDLLEEALLRISKAEKK